MKRFESPSFMSCSQSCLRNAWCSSTNFKVSFKKDGKGTCELNKHDSSLINENTKFHEQEGVTVSMLLKVIYTVLSIFLFQELVLVSAVQWLFINNWKGV